MIQIQKEDLHNKIIRLEKQLDAKQALELEIERLRGTLNVMKHMGDDEDVEVLQKAESILKSLSEKEGELEALDDLNQTLIVKQRKSNDELQEARKEIINVRVFSYCKVLFKSCLQDKITNTTIVLCKPFVKCVISYDKITVQLASMEAVFKSFDLYHVHLESWFMRETMQIDSFCQCIYWKKCY